MPIPARAATLASTFLVSLLFLPPASRAEPALSIAAGRLTEALRALRGAALQDRAVDIPATFDALAGDLRARRWSPRDPAECYRSLGIEATLSDPRARKATDLRARGAALLVDGPAIRHDSDEIFYDHLRVDQAGGIAPDARRPERLAETYVDYGVALDSLGTEAAARFETLRKKLRRNMVWRGGEVEGPVYFGVVGRLFRGEYGSQMWVLMAPVRRPSGELVEVAVKSDDCCF